MPFSRGELDSMLALASDGIRNLHAAQAELLSVPPPARQ
jgi:hypothetical protein